MTPNQKTLATIYTIGAIGKAVRCWEERPTVRVMNSLKEAIDSERIEIEEMVTHGKTGTIEYRRATGQYKEWFAAWQSNR